MIKYYKVIEITKTDCDNDNIYVNLTDKEGADEWSTEAIMAEVASYDGNNVTINCAGQEVSNLVERLTKNNYNVKVVA